MAIQKSELIWHNGTMVPWDEMNVHITTHALHYGSSVFEGIRAYETSQGPGIFRLTEGLIEAFGERRVIDTPLAESAIVGMAIGLGWLRYGRREVPFRYLLFAPFYVLWKVPMYGAYFLGRGERRWRRTER